MREVTKLYDEITIIKMAHGTIGDKIQKSVVKEVTELLKDLCEVDNTAKLSA